ncbi:BRO family protein [Pseudomonas moorei]|uniref:BRO-N domain-containing protein n=1 Tax=Pseudomonas moorei TaxID=395599 RepID=UPI0036F31738
MSNVVPFNFGDISVRVVMQGGDPWWVSSDVAQALEYSLPSAMTRHLDDEEKGMSTIHTLGGDQKMQVINESGLYSAIFKSRKESARRFKKWVTGEVLPTIRKTGSFGSVPTPVNLSDASALRGLLLGYTEQVLQLEHKISEDKPRLSSTTTWR